MAAAMAFNCPPSADNIWSLLPPMLVEESLKSFCGNLCDSVGKRLARGVGGCWRGRRRIAVMALWSLCMGADGVSNISESELGLFGGSGCC